MAIERIDETTGIIGRVARYSSRKWICNSDWLNPRKELGSNVSSRSFRKTLDSNDQKQVADQRFSLKQWFAGRAQSAGSKKPGSGQ